MPESINGWPVIQGFGDPRLAAGKVPGAKRNLTTRKEVLPLFLALAADYHRWVEPIDEGALDDWGYAYRPSRTSSAWSNHASGTAIDLNASKEGSRNPANRQWFARLGRIDQVKRIKKIYPIVNWGGDWSDRYYDPMHWELKAGTTHADVQRLIKKLGIKPDGTRTRNWAGIPLVKGKPE